MRLSTRLLLPLLAAVALVMSLYGSRGLRERERVMENEARRTIHAYATALGLALEGAFRTPALERIQEIVDRISQEPDVYGVLVYGADGEVLFASDLLSGAPSPRDRVRAVIGTGRPDSFVRQVDEARVYSVIRPLAGADGRVSAGFEVAQPLAFVEAEIRNSRNRFLVQMLTLLVTVSALILWLVGRMVGRPLREFVAAARAIGGGELAYRIPISHEGRELVELASEFNRMADGLESARSELIIRAEERLVLENRLHQTEKMAAIGKLAAGLAHEIAAPLNVVAGRAEILLRKQGREGAEDRNLRIIIDQIGRITVIVRNLLDFSRRREARMRSMRVTEVVDSVLEFLEGEFERGGITVHRDVDEEVVCQGDPGLLHQVFLNLLLNSAHALERSDGERAIWVTVRRQPLQPSTGEQAAVIEIRDSGVGIPEEHIADIFEPFYTNKAGGEGTGLGLAIARGILDEHGGHITGGNWESGAVFTVTLPCDDGGVHAR